MSHAKIVELVKLLKTEGVRHFKSADLEIEFERPGVKVEAQPQRQPDPEFPEADPYLFAHEGH